jgi:hypothetical protein
VPRQRHFLVPPRKMVHGLAPVTSLLGRNMIGRLQRCLSCDSHLVLRCSELLGLGTHRLWDPHLFLLENRGPPLPRTRHVCARSWSPRHVSTVLVFHANSVLAIMGLQEAHDMPRSLIFFGCHSRP